jgi:SAM-dependent methyltransferase
MKVDIWKYYSITHKKHIILNPMSIAKLDGLISLLDIKEGSRVLDIGCGKGEFLIRLSELYDISGIGVDISPYFIKECRMRKNQRIPGSDIKFLEMDGAKYKPDKNKLSDLTVCLGASFTYNGFIKTIKALKNMTKTDGMIIIGEPYWLREPDSEYLKMLGIKKEEYGSNYGNVDIAERNGLNCIYIMAGNNDDWDHYETLQWISVYDYINSNPNDPDNPELLKKTEKAKTEYLLYGRDTLGWAIYVFRVKAIE